MSTSLMEMPVSTSVEMDNLLTNFEYAIDDTLEKAMLYEVCSQWSAEEAMNLIAKIKGYHKKIEEIRKRVNEPFRKMMTSNNEKCKPFTERLERIEGVLMSKILIWKQKFELAQQKQEEEAELLREALQLSVTPFVKQEAKLRTVDALAYEKSVMKFEVTDFAQIPREYLMVDEDKIEAAMKAGVREIPGVRMYEEKKTIVRSR